MNIKDLSKEQKQYVALGSLSAAILVILMAVGIRFSMTTISVAKEELSGLTDKIDRANKALSRNKRTSGEYVETITVLKKYLENVPPERNYYSWATEIIYSKARLAELEIDSIDEITISQQGRSGPDTDAAAISFESYSLRIMGHGGYENTKYFINLLKEDYPLVRFSGVEISSGQNPEAHNVQLFIQWPFSFGEITRNWDTLASKQMKIAESNDSHEVASPQEVEPAPGSGDSATSAVRPVREPHPPTTRPVRREVPGSDLIAEQPVPEKKPVSNPGLRIDPPSLAVTAKPAASDEIQSSTLEQETEWPGECEMSDTVEPASMLDAPYKYVSTCKSEKILKERLNMRGTGHDAALSSLYGGLLGEINEK
jgi:hypothetical protein